jgi:hypothetical protein
VNALKVWTGWDIPLGRASRLIPVLVAVYVLARYWLRPAPDAFWQAVLGMMSAMVFSGSTHIWPWYGLWTLSLAALVPRSVLGIWAIGVALAMPFLILGCNVYPYAGPWLVYCVPTLLFYGFCLLWLVVVPRRWFPGAVAAHSILDRTEPA